MDNNIGVGVDQTASYKNPRGSTVQETLAGDRRPARAAYLKSSYQFLGSEDIPVTRYTSQEWFDKEVAAVWSKTWQVACRAEDIPNPGDYLVYDVVQESVIVTRISDGSIKAYVNGCLHRGNALCLGQGNAKAFRCPFHGFTWTLEGALRYIPQQWDFPHLDREAFHLPEVRLGEWGGFIFINLDDQAPPLAEYLEVLPQHLDGAELANRYKAIHISQVVPCNWKALQEAFIEGYHVAETHMDKDENGDVSPYGIPISRNDTGIEYDIWSNSKHINRLVYVAGFPSQYVAHLVNDEQQIVDAYLQGFPAENIPKLSDGERARPVLAGYMRELLEKQHRVDLSQTSDMDVLDQVQYNIFPNFTVWPTVVAPLCYRFRPNGRNVDEAIYEVWMLYPRPADGSPVEVAKERRLERGQPWASVPELGRYGPVIDQDMPNLPRLTKGLHALHKNGLTLANYQEIRIRHFHKTLQEYVEALYGEHRPE